MRDRTATTEPLTIGQQLVARWESPASGWSEPADLAEAIDAAIAAEIETCAKLTESIGAGPYSSTEGWTLADRIATAIRNRKPRRRL